MNASDFLSKITSRAKELVDKPIDQLRMLVDVTTVTETGAIKYCKDQGFTKGQLVESILYDEFDYQAIQLDVKLRGEDA